MAQVPSIDRSGNRLCPGIVDHVRAKRQREADVATALSHFHRKRTGRGPDQIAVLIVQDMVIVRQQATLSAAEQHLAGTAEGADLIQQFRRKLGEALRPELSDLIETLVGLNVVEAFSDTSRKGDRIDVFVLERSWEADGD
jgi:uncharacterized protein YbcI